MKVGTVADPQILRGNLFKCPGAALNIFPELTSTGRDVIFLPYLIPVLSLQVSQELLRIDIQLGLFHAHRPELC